MAGFVDVRTARVHRGDLRGLESATGGARLARVKGLLAVAFAACALLAPRSAAADGVTSSLSWVRLPGAEACATTPELGARVEKHLGRSVLVSPSVADVSIEGRIEPVGAGAAKRYRAVVGGTRKTGQPIGSREIVSETADCRSIDDGLVLVIALMIDPDAMDPARPAPPSPPVASPVTREIVTERVVVREVERPAAPSPAWLVDASAAGLASIARVPGISPGAAVALRTGPTRLVAFEVSFGAVPSAELGVTGGRAVEYTLLEGGLAYCPGIAFARRLEAIGCAGARLGAVRASGRGFDRNSDVDRGLFDVAVGARFAVDVVGPLFVVATGSLVVPVVRERTVATSANDSTITLHDRSAVGGELGAGLGLHFSP